MFEDILPRTQPEPKVVWEPLKGSQEHAITCPCNHILYEGTRGPGKTDWQLMFFRQYVGQGYGRFWRGVIFDREYKNLDDLVSKSLRWFPQFFDGAKFLHSASHYKWVWPTGEELLFRQLKRAQDYWNYHGQEFPFIGWNELTKYPTREYYDSMMSCNRTSFLPEEHTPKDEKGRYKTPDGKPLPEIPLVVPSTTNPYGPGHNWVKARFIDPAPPGKIIRTEIDVFNPRTQVREKIVRTQVRIFGSYKENRFLSPVYVASLESITDENKRRAWLHGDWDIVAGGALDDVWKPQVHIIKRFKIPLGWRIDRSFDWGSSKPFSVGWWAEANGEEAELDDGTKFCPPAGTLIRIAEWYGCTELGSNEGMKLGAGEVARGILERERQLLEDLWIVEAPSPGPADNAIRNVISEDIDTIEKLMSDEGVTWTESDKSPGSRKNGLELVRVRFKNCWFAPDKPGIYIMDNCRASISTLPVLPRDIDDPDDVDTEAEDHVYDEVRYRVLAASNRYATSVETDLPR